MMYGVLLALCAWYAVLAVLAETVRVRRVAMPRALFAALTLTGGAVVACALAAFVYRRHIENGDLRLKRVPHQNTLSNWMNDTSLTDVLFRILDLTVRPWRKREIAAIVDSSKVSQMRSAHSRYVEYGDDVRDAADWLKMHVLVGVKTLICMAVMFSGSRGAGTHDVNFILALVKKALKVFGLRYVLADRRISRNRSSASCGGGASGP
jgi:hypothetical protein